MLRISTFDRRLKEYRELKNLTLADLEKILNIPAQTLNRYELAQRSPKVNIANEIAQSLNINVLWLIGYDVTMDNTEIPKQHECTTDEIELLNIYRKLNKNGKKAAYDAIENLSYNPKYNGNYEYENKIVQTVKVAARNGNGGTKCYTQKQLDEQREFFEKFHPELLPDEEK